MQLAPTMSTFIRSLTLATALTSLAGCGLVPWGGGTDTGGDDASTAQGLLSASPTAANVAVLMTAWSYTPQYGNFFETDMQQMNTVLADPAGNYRMKTIVGQRAGHNAMLSYISQGAAQVSEDGTLFVFITAHGSANGQIEPEDQAYTTFGYAHILQAIRGARAGKGAFRRLVLFVSSCYSGSWLSTLQASSDFRELLVMTSVGPNQLSNIGQATRSLLNVFQGQKNTTGLTVNQFLGSVRQSEPSLMYTAAPQSILNETLVNAKGGSPTPDPVDPGGSTPGPVGDIGLQSKATVEGQQVRLYVYADRVVDRLEILAADGNWYELGTTHPAQSAWPDIRSTTGDLAWRNRTEISVRVTAGGATDVVKIPLSQI